MYTASWMAVTLRRPQERDLYRLCMTKMEEIGVGKIATVMGRYYAMDRDNRWDRVELAYNALVQRAKAMKQPSAASAQYRIPTMMERTMSSLYRQWSEKDGKPLATIQDGDSVIFFNFRPDRAREITRAFCCDEFDGFPREKRLDLTYVCFTEYDETIPNKDGGIPQSCLLPIPLVSSWQQMAYEAGTYC